MSKTSRKTTQPEIEQPSPIDVPEIQDAIAERSYQLYLSRGASNGHDLEDWLQAEREILQEAINRANPD